MMRKIAAMCKMMRKTMRNIVFIVFMRKMKISSSKGGYSKSEQHKTF